MFKFADRTHISTIYVNGSVLQTSIDLYFSRTWTCLCIWIVIARTEYRPSEITIWRHKYACTEPALGGNRGNDAQCQNRNPDNFGNFEHLLFLSLHSTGERPFRYCKGIVIGVPSVPKRLTCGADVPVFIVRNSVL